MNESHLTVLARLEAERKMIAAQLQEALKEVPKNNPVVHLETWLVQAAIKALK